MSRTAKTLVIQPDGTHEIRDVPTDYPGFNNAVLDGGYMECLYVVPPSGKGEVVFTFDEEGGPLIKGLSRNVTATRLYARLTGIVHMLFGPVAINAFRNGNLFDVADEVVELVKGLPDD